MGQLKDLIKEPSIRERRLTFKTYPLDDDRVILEGWFHDELLVPGYHWDGRPRTPGVIHLMCVRLLLGGWPLSIRDAEAEMPNVPHELCRTTLESVKSIVGLSIVSGYSEEVKKRMGGVKGCAHLAHLTMAMGPAALHGYWSQRSRKPRPVPRSMNELRGMTQLINSCKLWKEDGPLIQNIRAVLENT